MAWFLLESILFLALAFLLGVLVGWLVWGRWRRTVVASGAADAPAAAEPVAVEPVAVEPVAVPPNGHLAGPLTDLLPGVDLARAPQPIAVEPELAAEPDSEADPEPEAGPIVALVPAPAASANDGPVDDDPVDDDPADDLERIEGIGPRMAGALHAAGIRTYRKLAASTVGELRTAIENAGLTFAPSLVTWARQATLLADGDEDGFADLTRRLVAGRDVGR